MAKKVGEQPESREAKRIRLQNNRKAKETAKKYVYPTVIALFSLLVGFFFYKYGFGTSSSLSSPLTGAEI